MGIHWKKSTYSKHTGKDKNINGTYTEMRGYSIPFGTFLTKLVGHGSENKRVPDEAFSAPDEFIIGLLDGYFSGDGCIDKNSITVTSTSMQMIEGISMLCARIGIFGKMSIVQQKKNNLGTEHILPTYVLAIRSHWAKTFQKKIVLTHATKQSKLENISTTKEHINFPVNVNVVLDAIETIEELDISQYKKLYDVTVPRTLNFMIQNGMQCRDTAETGYVQRKLIKSMEDIMIKYDGTVRSANDRLIQIVYGDSGTDTTKQYEYSIKLMEYNNEDVRNKCVFTKDELKSIKGFSDDENEKLYKEIVKQRDHVRRAVRNSKMNFIQEIKNFMLPVNLNRVIDNIAGADMKGEVLTAKYVVEKINDILLNENTTLIYMSPEEKQNQNSFKRRDEMAHKQVFKLALFDALSPKRAIMDLKLNKAQFDAIVAEVISSFNKNMIEPGEQAGIIASQSTGEPFRSVD
jgi:predicted transcriptional regulator